MATHFHGPGGGAFVVLMGLWFASGPVAAAPAHAVHPGQATYQSAGCVVCHQPDAKGVAGVYPALAGRVGRIARSAAGRRYLVDVVAFGMVGTIEVDGQSISGLMPPHPQLSDQEIASTLNWLAGLDRKPGEKSAQFEAAYVHRVRAHPLSPGSVYRLRQATPGVQRSSDKAGHGRQQVSDARANWMLHCAGCHGLDGETRVSSVPDVRDFAGYFAHSERGRRYLARVPGASMSLLSDADLAAVLNWMLESFSGAQLPANFRPYTASEVHALRQHPLTLDVEADRGAVLAKLRTLGVIRRGKP